MLGSTPTARPDGRRQPAIGPRLVFVEQFYYPEGWGGAELPRDITTHLAERGYSVEVICGSDLYAPLMGGAGRDPAASGVIIRRIPRLLDGDIHHRKVLRQLWFYVGLLPRLLLGRAPAAYVTQTNPPLAVPLVAVAARLRRRPFVIIAMDIYPDVIVAHGALADGALVTRLLNGMFAWAYRSAARVVTLGSVMSQRLLEKGVAQCRVRTISNWATGATGVVHGDDNRLWREWRLQDRFVLLYSGNLGVGHEFRTLLLGFAQAQRARPDLQLVIIGKGSRLEETRSLVAELGLSDAVRFEGLVPADRLPESLGVAHIAIATLRPGFEGLIVPSKVLGYLARAIPVLYVGPRSDIEALIERYGCGYSVRNDDVDGVAAAILAAAHDAVALADRGERGRLGYEAELRRELGLAAYESVIAECLRSNGIAA